MVNEDSEAVAPANAGRSARGALDVIVPAKGLHEQPPDYLSYGFNDGNARANSNAPGIAERNISSWNRPKPPGPNGAPMFNDAMNMVSFVDGHVWLLRCRDKPDRKGTGI